MIINELASKLTEGEKKTKTGNNSIWKGGYPGRYKDNWRAEVEKVVNKKSCCITEMIDHMIAESTAVYAGTEFANSFMIYHDALTLLWEAKAREYIREKGFTDRFIHIIREYQDGINKRYWFTVVGDSPELARALDSFGFADLELSMAFHQALTSGWAANNPKKFQFGTPSQVWSAMSRCWEVEPTSERIVQDIIDLPRVLQKIIDAKGTVAYGEALRNGHRARRADGKGTMKGNLSSSRRKSTLSLRPIHPDARSALDAILGEEEAVIEETIESVENLIDACYDEHERDTSEIFEDVIEDVDILASYLNVE